MLIVNQREDIIINFTNVISIYVKEKDIQVLMNCIEDALILGKYATEKRAKEVLEEIIEKMQNKNFIDMTAEGITTEVSDGIYRMPEE